MSYKQKKYDRISRKSRIWRVSVIREIRYLRFLYYNMLILKTSYLEYLFLFPRTFCGQFLEQYKKSVENFLATPFSLKINGEFFEYRMTFVAEMAEYFRHFRHFRHFTHMSFSLPLVVFLRKKFEREERCTKILPIFCMPLVYL